MSDRRPINPPPAVSGGTAVSSRVTRKTPERQSSFFLECCRCLALAALLALLSGWVVPCVAGRTVSTARGAEGFRIKQANDTADRRSVRKSQFTKGQSGSPRSGNPILPGWYADPEAHVFQNEYWIYPTYSAPYDQQVFMDAFSSRDLITWEKHPRVLDIADVQWAKRALWAP